MIELDRADYALLVTVAIAGVALLVDATGLASVPYLGFAWGVVLAVPCIILISAFTWLLNKSAFYRSCARPYLILPREWYFNLWRRRTPDWLYKLWLQTGIMDEEAYRAFQERGFITDELDPKYIQRSHKND